MVKDGFYQARVIWEILVAIYGRRFKSGDETGLSAGETVGFQGLCLSETRTNHGSNLPLSSLSSF